MKLSAVVLTLVPSVFGQEFARAVLVDCHADNCYRAVAGDDAPVDLTSRQNDCIRLMTATVTPGSTTITDSITTTLRPTPVERAVAPVNATSSIESVLPTTASLDSSFPSYATICSSLAAYSSACSCWGITGSTLTAATVGTVQTTTIITVSSTSVSLSGSPTSISSSRPTSKPTTTTTPKSSSTTTTPFSSSTSSTILPTTTTTTNSTSGSCIGKKCGTYQSWSCSGPLGDCLCGIDPNGQSFCFEDNVCSVEANCATNADCSGTNQRCVIGSCCNVGKCVVERKTGGVCGNANLARAIFGMKARGGGFIERCELGKNSGSC